MNFKFFQRWMHGSRELADDFIRSGIDDWSAEGHPSEEATSPLRTPPPTPAAAAVPPHPRPPPPPGHPRPGGPACPPPSERTWR